MLVLSRKIGERIHIGDNITIEIRRVAGNRVTLALEAPRDVRILRGELEKAATEFEGPAEKATIELDLDRLQVVADHLQSEATFAQPTDSDDTTGPEPYAVIHRRLHVVPEYSPVTDYSTTVPSDFAL
jgi:carbon storage regulator